MMHPIPLVNPVEVRQEELNRSGAITVGIGGAVWVAGGYWLATATCSYVGPVALVLVGHILSIGTIYARQRPYIGMIIAALTSLGGLGVAMAASNPNVPDELQCTLAAAATTALVCWVLCLCGIYFIIKP